MNDRNLQVLDDRAAQGRNILTKYILPRILSGLTGIFDQFIFSGNHGDLQLLDEVAGLLEVFRGTELKSLEVSLLDV
jgi:hypothetical protein